MTAKGNTKQEILDAALELFSVQGYEATSISQIAEAVGIRKASLYSHFENKQAILDALIQTTLEQYEMHSIFANANWEDPDFTKDKEHMTPETAAQMIRGQIYYILHDPQISKARKMLTIEQFQNTQIAQLQTKQNYTGVMGYFTGLVRFLIRQGKLKERDPEIMAAQLCLPISVWINLCDREPEREGEIMKLIERHIRLFFELYQVNSHGDKLIGCCGLDCEKCDARIATITGDEALREKTAALWTKLNGVTITPEMINCTGCRVEGAKTPFCDSLCQVHRCVREKGLETCADCAQMDDCQTLGCITANNPSARENLKRLL